MTSPPGSSDGVVLRPVRVTDAAALAVLHVEVWEDAYRGLVPDAVLVERRAGLAAREERWRAIVATSPAATTVAERVADGRLLGFASAGPARDADLAALTPAPLELWALYVAAVHWGTGLGHRLLEHALGGGTPASLWVLRGNDRAIGFYERHGFALDGTSRTDELGTELRMRR